MQIYFGLGSNLGDRLKNLRDALEKIKSLGKITSVSGIYETKAWGGVVQPDFLNACAKVERENFIEPLEILRAVKNFENELGREKSVRWGPRKIDIDILLIDDIVYKSSVLNVPHISLPERLFVLVPLKDILPSAWRHPENKKTLQEMIEALPPEDVIQKL